MARVRPGARPAARPKPAAGAAPAKPKPLTKEERNRKAAQLTGKLEALAAALSAWAGSVDNQDLAGIAAKYR
jgi:hypothetical protein